jgi:hypothetical protein
MDCLDHKWHPSQQVVVEVSLRAAAADVDRLELAISPQADGSRHYDGTIPMI